MRFLGLAKHELSQYVLADFVPHSVLHEFWQAFDQHDGSLPNGSSTSLISATGDSHQVCWAVAGDTLVVRGLAAAETQAVADAVTGLPDRRAFRERVERAIREQRSNWGCYSST